MIRASLMAILLVVWNCVAWSADVGPSDPLTYEQHIRPIFRAHCFDCHGSTTELEGGLDLRLVRLMKAGGESGAAILPGRPDESLLLDRLLSGEMPPGETRVPDSEIALIERWIAGGAKTVRDEPESIGPGLGITPEERAYWAFQSIKRPETGNGAGHDRVRTPIDAIVLQGINSQGVDAERPFEPDADRRALVMRASFDLTGLPPSAEQVAKWADDPRHDWYDRLIDDLLESPHYGERWARHWLDVAGYADSEGYTVGDVERPWAWKYRDWVIRAFNEDKPFDQFVTEQLAGDEIAGPLEGDLTTEQIELLTATGFLRLAADGTGNGANNDEAKNQVMGDTLKIVSSALMGLSIQCAQCHDHRYDPIPQTDYFALRAVFEPALDWKAWKTPNARLVSLYTAEDRRRAAEIEIEAKKIEQERSQRQAEYMKQAIDKELAKHDEPLRTSLRQAYETAAKDRTDEQKQLLTANPSVNITPGNLYQYIPDSKPALEEFGKRIAETRARKPAEQFLRTLIEPANHVPETKLFHRGDFAQPKQTIAPGPLSVVEQEGEPVQFPSNDPNLPTTGRRTAFARWLTSRDNPLLSRVIVNRVWMHHFGKGLVATAGEFGKLGTSPSDPLLLDWLANDFMENGWSLKHLHRVILSSTVWRQRTVPSSNNPYATTMRRLEAEIIRDRMLVATGSLDDRLFGPPLKIKEDETGQVIVEGGQPRRSLYIQARRSRPVALLETFDAPEMETNCETRANSTVATQSLMLLNGQFILDQSAKLADRAALEAKPITAAQRALLPGLPTPTPSLWQYGYGNFDPSTRQTDFTAFPHWTGDQWRGGESLPDTRLGWAFLNSSGGHPDSQQHAVIRRWVANRDCAIRINGQLSHPSEHGDGVQGRIVSNRLGIVGQWNSHHGTVDTPVDEIEVGDGDTVDFIVDCRSNFTSDSFTWPVTLTVRRPDNTERSLSSQQQFAGPPETTDGVPGQVIRAWQLAYCRDPNDEELKIAIEFISNQITTMVEFPSSTAKGRTIIQQAMTNLCQSLLSSNEFLYVE